MTEENIEKIKEIKSNLQISTTYLKQLGENAESSYEVWLSLNKDTADETEIAAKKIEMLGNKLLYNKQIVEYTKNAYLEIKKIAGDFAPDTIELESLYLSAGKNYNNILAERNNAVNSAAEKEAKRVAEINKQIDKENFETIGISESKGDLSSFAKVNEIIQNFNKFINEHKEAFLEVGGTYEELLELAKKQTGYDKVEEAYFQGRTGDVSLLKPHEQARSMGTLMESQIELPEFDESVISEAYANNFAELGEEAGVIIDGTLIPVFYDTGVKGIMKLLSGMIAGLEGSQAEFDTLGKSIIDKLMQSVEKAENAVVVNNYSNNYNNSYNIEEMGSSAYRSLVNWERFQQLKKMRGAQND